MNKWETRYAEGLAIQKNAGLIREFYFEPFKLRLAKNTYYKIDFLVVPVLGPWEIHEVKGFWRDDARVKFKVAAEQYRAFQFVCVQLVDGEWRGDVLMP